MRKSQRQAQGFKGEITAFMALVFLLMLSLVAALLESASIHIEKNCKRADTRLALESVFAEYNQELLEQYDLFAHLGSDEQTLKERLHYYGADGAEHSLEQMQLLTDENGSPFYEQAVREAKSWLGLESFSFGNQYEFQSGDDLKQEEEKILGKIEGALKKVGATLGSENNPLQILENLKRGDLITLLIANPGEVSQKSINKEQLPSGRTLAKGNYKEAQKDGIVDKAFFVYYLTEHFRNRTNGDEQRALLYEVEYLLGGKKSDSENLAQVCEKILQIRMLANYAYLLTDSSKTAEAKSVATGLTTLIALPELEPVVEQGILLAWAYGESIVDVRGLLKGNPIPLIKTADSWQLQLSNLAKLGTQNEIAGEKTFESGLEYKDYLIGLLLLENKDALCMRGLDLIEGNLHIETDRCMTKVEIKSHANLRRGIKETFTTNYGYQ